MIFHIFSLPNLFMILFSWDGILMCMSNLFICTFIHLTLIAFSNKRTNMPTPRTVTETLNSLVICYL